MDTMLGSLLWRTLRLWLYLLRADMAGAPGAGEGAGEGRACWVWPAFEDARCLFGGPTMVVVVVVEEYFRRW